MAMSACSSELHPVESPVWAGEGSDWVEEVADWLRSGARVGERSLVLLPSHRATQLRSALGPAARRITFRDRGTECPKFAAAWQYLTGRGETWTRVLDEPMAFVQRRCEADEMRLHQNLLPLMCGDRRVEARYLHDGAPLLCSVDTVSLAQPLPPRPRDVLDMIFLGAAGSVRAVETARSIGRQSGLANYKIQRLATAVGELAANCVKHSPTGGGQIACWVEDRHVVAELTNWGSVDRRAESRPDGAVHLRLGQGLWGVLNRCDLVQLRSDPWSTTVRVHLAV
jgi:anti-sigma regulatory factor (Ser/Thr protein kinase)